MINPDEYKSPGWCGCLIVVLFVNIFFGSWSVDTIVSWFGSKIWFGWAFLIGLFLGQFTISIAVIGNILKLFKLF
jgi:hypothetical protein